MSRKRAVAVVIDDDSLLVMHRKKDGVEYYTLPGGGVEDGETPEEAVVREIDEECSLKVEAHSLIFTVHREDIESHYHYLCKYISGEPRVREGTNEFNDNLGGTNLHIPEWIDLGILERITLYPEPVKVKLLEYLKSR